MSNSEISDKPILAILGGTGKEGTGLAMRWANAGYPVIIGSRLREKAESTALELNEKLGLKTISGMTNEQAALAGKICVLTVVQAAHQDTLRGLRDVLQGKILVDATARVDFRDPRPPDQPSAARVAQGILGSGVRVVAAFQNVPAHVLKKNFDSAIDTDVLVCADDEPAAQTVITLAQDGGMQAFYAGGLDNAVVVEGITSLLISINKYYGIKTASIAVTGIESKTTKQPSDS
jgi:hypothetical protein